MRHLRGWARLFPWRWWQHEDDHESPCDLGEATAARHVAETQLRQARARRPEVAQVAGESRQHQIDNHFAQLISETFQARH